MDHGVIGVHGGGHVLVGVAVRRVRDNQGGLPYCAVSDEHALDLVAVQKISTVCPTSPVFRIRIRIQIRPDPKLFGLKDPDPKLLISDPDPDPPLFTPNLKICF